MALTANQIRGRLLAIGMDDKQVAKLCGVTRATVTQTRLRGNKGTKDKGAAVQLKIAELLGMPAAEVWGERQCS